MCEISNIFVEGKKVLSYGSRCGKHEVENVKKTSNVPDLIHEREKFLLDSYSDDVIQESQSLVKIGIPRSMLLFNEYFPFWNTFLAELGLKVIISNKTNRKIVRIGLENTPSEFCFPIKLLYGHVLNVVEKGVDIVFLPSILSTEKKFWKRGTSTCPYVFNIPYIVEAALNLKNKGIKILRPQIDLARGKEHLDGVIFKMCKELKLKMGKKRIQEAIQKGYENQRKFTKAVEARGIDILKNLNEEQYAFVIIGRLYNTCDETINLGVNKILNERDIMAIPIDFLPLSNEKADSNLFEEWPIMYWQQGQRILKAAQFIREHDRFFALYLTNFGCGPDSYILNYFRRTMRGKPYLEIEVDEHGADVGVITRCEAFLDSLSKRKNQG